jgi:hypothetical protein
VPTDRWAQGLLIIGDAGCTGGDGTKHCARHFPKRRELVNGRESHRQIRTSSFCFLAPKLLCLLSLFFSSPPPSRSHPPFVALASILPASRFWSGSDLTKLRRLLGWQSSGYDERVQCGAIPLKDLRPSEFIFFTSYALTGLVPPFSSFFFTLLEWYNLQLHHLSPHYITLVVIFIHFCEMHVGVRSSVRLFRLFHVLRSSRKRAFPIGGYYFQNRTKGTTVYITAITPDNWDRWKDDLVIMQAEVHDRLELLTIALTGHHSSWEKVPDLQSAYLHILKRIQFLAENDLTSMMVLFDFLSKRITPL